LVSALTHLNGGPPTVLTIHNLGYQGHAGLDALPALGLTAGQADTLGLSHAGGVNLLKGGIECATMLSTVSPRYAQEIQTVDGGAGLHGSLQRRTGDLVGILNGIDDSVWDPSSDQALAARYGADDLSGKAMCKEALQRELGLPVRPRTPLLGLVSRFVEQKGIDIFAGALDKLLAEDLQFAVLGSGEAWAERRFGELDRTTPSFRARFGLDEGLAHRIEAGCDLFVMPSRYEPCGLNQMYSQRYGTLPIVRAVGGLRDTVEHEVDGFVFEDLTSDALVAAVQQATRIYHLDTDGFRDMQRLAMRKRMGWDRAAMQYDALYRLTLSKAAPTD
jgi:starch synthase